LLFNKITRSVYFNIHQRQFKDMCKTFTSIVVAAFMAVAYRAGACDCYFSEYFCETISSVRPIAMGIVIEKKPGFMNVKVLEWLIPGDNPQDTISIINGSPSVCLSSILRFAAGDILILAPLPGGGWAPETPYTGYVLSGCEVNHLYVENNKVKGPIRKGVNEQAYAQFRTEFKGCLFEDAVKLIKVFPNPVQAELHLRFPEGMRPYRIQVFNALGREVPLPMHADGGDLIRADVAQLNQGVYFVVLEFEGGFKHTMKWIKV